MVSFLNAGLSAALLCAAAAAAAGPICAPSNAVGVPGIGDGCTIPSGVGILFPDIGAFQGTFTPACNKHDKCYSTLGTSYGECDGNFLSEMRSACRSRFNPFFFPFEYTVCNDVANKYYVAVVAYGQAYNPLPGIQADALNRSRQMGANVNADVCVTTPEATTLYSPGLIAQVNSAFTSYAGRLPTLYEFFGAVNAGNIVADPGGWQAQLVSRAVSAASVFPPAIGFTRSMSYSQVTYSANPQLPGASYLWKLNSSTASGPAASLPLRNPQYDQRWAVDGFVRAISSTGVRNVMIVHDTVYEQGWCATTPGSACF